LNYKVASKSCPRCHGDLFLDYDIETGLTYSCLQCGYEKPDFKILESYEQERVYGITFEQAKIKNDRNYGRKKWEHI
jgi:C4-type Zn-finger protein